MKLLEYLISHWYIVVLGLAIAQQVRARLAKRRLAAETRADLWAERAAPQEAARQQLYRSQPRGFNGSAQAAEPASFSQPSPFAPLNEVPAPSAPSAQQQNAPNALFPAQPEREEVLKGIVWSEILGPPRAKKPYRRL